MPRTSIIQASFNRLHILSPRFVPRIPVRAALQIQAVPRTSIIVCDLSLLSVPTLSGQRALSSAAVAAQSGGAVVGGDAIVAFNLADIGEGITEVEVLKWFVKEGDHVDEFDRLCEVQSDKATVEISSRYTGQLVKICHDAGAVARVGAPLVFIRLNDSPHSPAAAATSPPQPPHHEEQQKNPAADAAPNHPSEVGDGKKLATPAVRAIAKEHKIDISTVTGTGVGGRVTKADMLAVIEERQFELLSIDAPLGANSDGHYAPSAPEPPQTRASASLGAAESAQAAAWNEQPLPAGRAAGALPEDRAIPVRGYTRTMIKTMQAQVQVPHFGYSDEYEMDGVISLRKRLLPLAEGRGARLTYMPIIIKALSVALEDFPEINATLSPDHSTITYRGSHNIGIAVDSPSGLVVPNIKGLQNLSVLEVAAELARLSEAARNNSLKPADLEGGTITLSNVGAIGGTYTSPILMPGEACIGAMGAIERIPRYDAEGNLAPTMVMRMSWSGDHRLLAGATLARFSNRFKALLADPSLMLLALR